MPAVFVDADGHILEPTNLWLDNLEPQFRDRAIRLEKDRDGLQYWQMGEERFNFYSRGLSSNVATIGKSKEWRKEHIFEKRDITWEDGLEMNPGAWDPHQRIKLMDNEGIDKSIMYPTLALELAHIKNPTLAAAFCRAYNNWITDFSHHYPDRLYPAMTLPWMSVAESLKELKRTENLGPHAVQAPTGPPKDIPFGDIHWDDLWAEFQEQDMPVSLHVGTAGTPTGTLQYPELDTPCWYVFANATDIQVSFLSFFQGNVFDRFPRLRVVILESGCAWMPWYLHRMDEKFAVLGFTTNLKEHPSTYFKQRCWISMDPDDELAPFTIKELGADRVIWAYDYPHSDSPVNPVPNLKKNLKGMRVADQHKVMGGNAIGLYKLNGQHR